MRCQTRILEYHDGTIKEIWCRTHKSLFKTAIDTQDFKDVICDVAIRDIWRKQYGKVTE